MSKSIALEAVPGFKLAAVAAEIRNWDKPRNDLSLIVADEPAATAGVFTTNKIAAAPVKLNRKNLKASGGCSRAILVNAGVANACTGEEGMKNAKQSACRVAKLLDCRANQVLLASTGVISRQLPMDRMDAGVDAAVAKLGKGKQGDVAKAIMTTDLRPKEASATLDDGLVIAGACKGSGMIAPNMATMLAFILTNARVTPKVLRSALVEVADATFNMVTIDGDTSTNDSLFIMASGTAEGGVIDHESGKRYDKFLAGLHDVALSLSRQIAIDGEGATKLVRVRVVNARKRKDAVAAARTIAESPLVKTAMFGNDPNWGRIAAALGRSGAKVEEDRLSIALCGRSMLSKGSPVLFDAKELSGLMKAKEIDLDVDLGLGDGDATVLTCDFSYEYVKINADYTT